MKRFLTAATLTLSVFAMPAFAQSCGGTYVVKRGESLSLIADRQYKDVGKWTAIHSANLSAYRRESECIACWHEIAP